MDKSSIVSALASDPLAPVQSTSGISASLPASSADLITFVQPFSPDAFANGFATLVGALVGAMLAYFLQRRLQQLQDRKTDLTAAHRLMFSLLQQINTIALIQRDHVYSELKERGRFISIPATAPFDTKKNVLDLQALSFMLRDRESRKLLYDFYLAQENYVEALNQWNLRSMFHLERLQPALAASGIANGSEVAFAALQQALGDQIYFHAINSTDNCVIALQRAFQRLAPLKKAIREYLVTRFKTDDFTDSDFPETWGLADPLPDKSDLKIFSQPQRPQKQGGVA